MRRARVVVRLVGLVACLASPVAAEPSADPGRTTTDVEVPAIVIEASDDTTTTTADDAVLDLANIVQSAAKGVTTVQEAPAIVTVITAEEIRDRQFQNLAQLYDTVPGWRSDNIGYASIQTPTVRGQVQAVQFLHDGVSLFDPFVNIPAASRVQPMELIKRVEMITGPGGVLWGSNSLLGILNIITKDAEDVDGVEVGGQLGDGNGDRRMARAYVMAGKSDLLHGKLKAFGHASIETYQGPGLELPLLLFHNTLPQPNSANVYGPLTETDQAQSMVATLFTKLTYQKLQLRVSYPVGAKYSPAGLSGNPSRVDLPDDGRCPAGLDDPTCADPRHLGRKNREDVFDRYAVAEYRTRFAKEKAGITARTYLIQFVRGFSPTQALAPSPTLQGGLALQLDLTNYRAGSAFDGDYDLSSKLRLQYGAEAFREWKPDTVTRSRQGPGTESEIPAPYNLNLLPLLCPRIFDPSAMARVPVANCPLTAAFPADRTVLGAYLNPQYRPNKQLILDAGARAQIAPEQLGTITYPVDTTVAASLVYKFIPNWHVKLNYVQGFRPPVFNNTTSNGEAVQIGGNPNLAVEKSDAAQVEINARIWKGERRVRELSFRLDGSYTRVNNLIQITSGHYSNSGDRGIASVEFLGKLFVQGGHRIELGYTYLRADTGDKGRLVSLPEHWFDIATVFTLVTDKLSATSRLKVTGAAEDPNRLVEYRGLTTDAAGIPQSTSVAATDLVLDRLPPIAELSLGVQYTPLRKLAVRVTAYNALVSHAYQPDSFSDYEPHLEYVPNPYEGFRAYLSAVYQY